ncbi:MULTISPECIES: metallophosphoesterase family protein [unclassified Avibacterium]|uniref:metallophosphoesterase family protein n=1 Tax=unclassified Avibacterium TaxID=2685287 RepID=UPI0020268112|nr:MULTISPECIES: metallophosphoesterase [unclassified Avibacterium]MCW9699914.1 metallophosphoesterase [Avibacterium sp. 20-129]URL02155.1 metallophosphoesterase [Avibacterium sp. 20-126]URL06534.1 metallophosphoesterase [Avibacterium sp. 21-595]
MILFAGDPHGRYDHLYPFVQEQEGIALVILGDLQLTSTEELDKLAQHCDLWFIHGNHDSKTVAAFEALWGTEWKKRNLHGRVQTIQGKRIAGLGGVFRGQIWMPPNKPVFFDPIHYCQYCPQEKIWRGGLPLRHRTSLFPSDFEQLENLQADILVSHEAPKPHPLGFSVFNKLAKKMGVTHIFHGHHHENVDYSSINRDVNLNITNVGFRSLCDEQGNYLLKNIDDRK